MPLKGHQVFTNYAISSARKNHMRGRQRGEPGNRVAIRSAKFQFSLRRGITSSMQQVDEEAGAVAA